MPEDPQTQIAAQAVQIAELSQKVDDLTEKVNQLIALFNGAKGVLTAVKWIGGIGTFVLAVYAAMSGHIK